MLQIPIEFHRSGIKKNERCICKCDINGTKSEKKVRFGDLSPGNIFIFVDDLFIKLNDELALNLEVGLIFDSISFRDLVRPVNAIMTVESNYE